jgi:hypothetical protein
MPLPERIILWLLTAWLAVFLPAADEPESFDALADSLAAKAFPSDDAGVDAWPAIERAIAQVHQSSTAFTEAADAQFTRTSPSLYEPVEELPDLPADQLPLAKSMQREYLERLEHAGVWRTLAEAAIAPRCRPPLVRYSDMGTELFTSLRIATLSAAMQARFAADRGDWDVLHDALLAMAACASASEARGTMIGALFAFALDQRLALVLCETLPRVNPTTRDIRTLRAHLQAARSRRLTLAQVLAFEELFWIENEAMNRNFADRWPVNGVRRGGDFVVEIGVLDLSFMRGEAPPLWPRIGVAVFGPLLADRTASRAAMGLGLRAFVREMQPEHPYATRSARTFEEHARALPLRFIIESRTLLHATTLMRRAMGLLKTRETIDAGTELVLALASYRAAHAVYPPTLESLVPDHIATIPRDTLAPDGRFRYRPSTDAKAYTLYSVGLDGEDNDAAAHADIESALGPSGKGTDYVFVPSASPHKPR